MTKTTKKTSKRQQLITRVVESMGYYIRRGNRDLDMLFADTVGGALKLSADLEAELDRLDDMGRKWARFRGEVMKAARRDLNDEITFQRYRSEVQA